MKSILLTLVALATFSNTHAQGCVAIRSNGGTCAMSDPQHTAQSGWVLGINTRYFRSFRHYSATEEQKQRVAQHTEVINHTALAEIGLTRLLNNRWSVAVFAPLLSNSRSSLYEHDGRNRFTTRSFGLGDVRLAAYRWMLDPHRAMKANVQLGIGLKLPTGDYRYTDYFRKSDSLRVLGPVDQSIQLGDGGTGLTLEANSYYHFSSTVSAYGNAYYLLNPRGQNGVSTARGSTPSAASILYGSDVMSVPDQYMVRGGASVAVKQLTLSAGARMECVPVHDLVGGSNGFRRPGYVLAAEPVLAFKTHRAHMYLSVPYAIKRARTQSVPDKIRTRITGTPYTGDAAFADYSVNAGIAFQLK